MPFVPDRGPWRAELWPAKHGELPRVVIVSDHFDHDVALTISGDFAEPIDKLEYAQDLAYRMNFMPGTTRCLMGDS